MSNTVEDHEHRYEVMKLMDQPGKTLTDKMLSAYRSQNLIPSDLQNLSDSELLQRLKIEDFEQELEAAIEDFEQKPEETEEKE